MAIVPTVSMLDATMGIPFQVAPLLRNLYSRCRAMVARLGASDRLGRISTSSKSSLGSLSIRMVGDLRKRQNRGKRGSRVHFGTKQPEFRRIRLLGRQRTLSARLTETNRKAMELPAGVSE